MASCALLPYETVEMLIPLPWDYFNSYNNFFSLHTIFFFPAVLNPIVETYRSPLQDYHGERQSSRRADQVPTRTVLPVPPKSE